MTKLLKPNWLAVCVILTLAIIAGGFAVFNAHQPKPEQTITAKPLQPVSTPSTTNPEAKAIETANTKPPQPETKTEEIPKETSPTSNQEPVDDGWKPLIKGQVTDPAKAEG